MLFRSDSLDFVDPRRLDNGSHNGSDPDDDDDLFPRSVRITIAVVYMVVCVVGLVGNCLVMYVIIR